MEFLDILTSFFALVFVLSLVGLAAITMRKYSNQSYNKNGKKRLSIEESINIDAKRRLMIIRRDDSEHLILTSQNSETIIEKDLKKNAKPKNKK